MDKTTSGKVQRESSSISSEDESRVRNAGRSHDAPVDSDFDAANTASLESIENQQRLEEERQRRVMYQNASAFARRHNPTSTVSRKSAQKFAEFNPNSNDLQCAEFYQYEDADFASRGFI